MLDTSNFLPALKEFYSEQHVQNMVYKHNPLFAIMPKKEQFGGSYYPQPIVYGNPQGRSQTFATAQSKAAASNSLLNKFMMPRVHNYQLATIQNEVILASQGDLGAFMEAATLEIDGAINNLSRDIAIDMYRSGFGEKGQIASTFTVAGATTIKLQNASDITNFEVGQEIYLSASLSGALKAVGTSAKGLIITKIDRSVGSETLTFGYAIDDATNGIPTVAAGDYIFLAGDHTASSMTKVAGLAAWLPTTAPSAGENFFGVDRSVDNRLSGVRLDRKGTPIEEAVIDLLTVINRDGGSPDYVVMNSLDWGNFEKALGSKVTYVTTQVTAEIGFRGIEVMSQKGAVKVIPDQNCPQGLMYALQMDTWTLRSIGKAVRLIDTDSLQMLRLGSADGVEIRYGFYGNMMTNAPGWNGVCQIS